MTKRMSTITPLSKPPRRTFSVDVAASAGKTHAAMLRRMLPKARAMVGGRLEDLSVAIVGDRKMAELHETYMGIAGPTDVLTFELDHDARGRVTAGEVVVCVPHAARLARAARVPLRDELLLYALHGMLHLAGFDDRTGRDFAAMHQREDDILQRLGVGAVFSRGAAVAVTAATKTTARRRQQKGGTLR